MGIPPPTGKATRDNRAAMTIERARQILAKTEVLLLDFDGPVCSVFAGLPAPIVADRLRNTLNQPLPADVEATTDPFDILKYAATISTSEADRIEKELRNHEVEAVHTARPTVGAHDLIRAWKATGRQLAIVSNNSRAAITTYLSLHHLATAIDAISARETPNIAQLKPDPYLVSNAIKMSRARPSACTLIGDSPTDIEAAHAAGTLAIGYARTPSEGEALCGRNPGAIVTTMPSLK